MKNIKIVFGEYDQYGYEIFFSNGKEVEQIYRAGNSPYDSTIIIPCEDECSDALSTKILRQQCIKTGKEMAKEKNCKWGGVEKVSTE